jgi:hypothetical protein
MTPYLLRRPLLLLLIAGALPGAEPPAPAGAPQVLLEDVRSTNEARGALARERAEWTAERERLQAISAATGVETQRQEREASEATAAADKARTEADAIGTASDLDALRAQLAAAAAPQRDRLEALARTLPPGVLTVPSAAGEENLFDAIARSLDGAEHAASAVSVEVVPGTIDGGDVAVKILRVAGACAWWVDLEDQRAGTAVMTPRGLSLTAAANEDERVAIVTALAVVEGRHLPVLVTLPFAPISAGGAP